MLRMQVMAQRIPQRGRTSSSQHYTVGGHTARGHTWTAHSGDPDLSETDVVITSSRVEGMDLGVNNNIAQR